MGSSAQQPRVRTDLSHLAALRRPERPPPRTKTLRLRRFTRAQHRFSTGHVESLFMTTRGQIEPPKPTIFMTATPQQVRAQRQRLKHYPALAITQAMTKPTTVRPRYPSGAISPRNRCGSITPVQLLPRPTLTTKPAS